MDFLSHLVDAPLANILIVAGLIFLGIAAVGKVTGKIEPDKFGRLVAGLLGVALLAAGVVTHVQGDKARGGKSVASVQPAIRAFYVSSPEIRKGGKVTIHWDVSDADDVRLEPFGQVKPSDEMVVEPQQTTTYKLSATNKGGGRSDESRQVFVNNDVKRITGTSPPVENASEVQPVDNSAEAAAPVYTSQPPPPLPDYDRPTDPGGNSVWTPGSWYYDSALADYYWVPGAWVVPPNNLVWTPPYWQYDSGRYRWYAGYWGPHVGFYGGIDYGFGYPGSGYDRGRDKTQHPVSYNGGLGGAQRRPTPKELAAGRDRQDVKPLDVQKELARSSKKTGQFFGINHGRPDLVRLSLPLTTAAALPRQIEDEQKKADEQRKADQQKAEQQRKQIEEQRKREEEQRAQERKRMEEQKKGEEQKRADEERKAREKREEEERRRRQGRVDHPKPPARPGNPQATPVPSQKSSGPTAPPKSAKPTAQPQANSVPQKH